MNFVLSKTIDNLRFPLACLVVLQHYYTPDVSAEKLGAGLLVYGLIGDFFGGKIFTSITVPLFMVISGFLYFSSTDGNLWRTYIKKTKRRFKSILLPYIIWNFLILVLYSFVQIKVGNGEAVSKEGYKFISDYTFVDYVKAFWAMDSTGKPIDGPLWFIRDLFVLSIISPFIYYGIYYLRIIFVILSFVLVTIPFDGMLGSVINYEIPYFVIGAYLALNKKNYLEKMVNAKINITNLILCYLTALLFLACAVLFDVKCYYWASLCYRIVASFCFIAFAAWFAKKGLYVPSLLTISSFFLFAIHKPIMVIVRRITFSIFHPHNEFCLCLLFFLIPIAVILVAEFLFYCIKRFMPWLKILNGYRM